MSLLKAVSKQLPLAILLAVLCAPALASAQQQQVGEQMPPPQPRQQNVVQWSERNELIAEFRGPTFYATDSTFDAVSDDDTYSDAMLGVGYDLGERTVPGLRGLFLFHGGGLSQDRFQGATQLDWHRNLFLVGADWGPELWGVFRPAVRLGAGYALQNLEVNTTGPTRDDYAHDLAGLGQVTFALSTPRDWLGPVSVGFIGGLGYLAQTSATFDELEAGYGGEDPWTYEQADLGEINASGVFWDLGVSVRLAL